MPLYQVHGLQTQTAHSLRPRIRNIFLSTGFAISQALKTEEKPVAQVTTTEMTKSEPKYPVRIHLHALWMIVSFALREAV